MEEDSLGITGPGGTGVNAKGQQTITAVMLVILAAIVATGLWMHDSKADEKSEKTVAALKAVTESISKLEESQKATTRVMAYVMSLPDEEKRRLNLTKPRELQDMQR